MKVVFRTDASIAMGTGHVMRCLTLAEELKQIDASCVYFITRAHSGHMADTIRSKGYGLHLLTAPVQGFQPAPDDVAHAKWLNVPWAMDVEESLEVLIGIRPDWLIVDHYSLDARWHRLLRPYVGHIFVIDDLADRELHCDMLLDQTYGREQKDFQALLDGECRMLLGSRYAILRREFSELRSEAVGRRKRFDGLKRILVSLGGTDPDNVTAKILDSLKKFEGSSGPFIDVILGGQAPHLESIRKQAKNHPLKVEVSTDVDDMAIRMLKADLAIGAGGSTSWERCCLGLPALTICLGLNQKRIILETEKAGAAIYLGGENENFSDIIPEILHRLNRENKLMTNMSKRCFHLVDGYGAGRIVREMQEIS